MNETVISLAACMLFAAGIGLCTYLFVTLKQEMNRSRKESRELEEALRQNTASIREEMASIQETLKQLDRRTGELPQLASPMPGMNTTRRTQALRLHRRGDRPEQIAAALGIARGEVDLLLKVQQTSGAA